MPTPVEKALYTANASATGGRAGHVATDDKLVDVDLAMPPGLGGPGGKTNPEQLFAAGYAACFQGALAAVAKADKVDTSSSTVSAAVTIGPVDGGGFGLAVALTVAIPGVDTDQVQALADKAHEFCPYSRATRGNIEVTVSAAES